MKRGLILSVVLNIICLPLAAIYLVRKVQFYNSLSQNTTSIKSDNVFYNIRNSEFKTLEIDSNSIVFLGDSHTQNFEVAEYFNNNHVKNRGIILDGTAALLTRLGYVINGHPQKIFIQIGINDLLSGVSPEIISNDIGKMIDEIKAGSPLTAVYIQTVFPTNWNKYKAKTPVLQDIQSLNFQLKALTIEKQCVYIDLYPALIKDSGLNPLYDSGDNLHLNGAGYLLWRDSLKRYIN